MVVNLVKNRRSSIVYK